MKRTGLTRRAYEPLAMAGTSSDNCRQCAGSTDNDRRALDDARERRERAYDLCALGGEGPAG